MNDRNKKPITPKMVYKLNILSAIAFAIFFIVSMIGVFLNNQISVSLFLIEFLFLMGLVLIVFGIILEIKDRKKIHLYLTIVSEITYDECEQGDIEPMYTLHFANTTLEKVVPESEVNQIMIGMPYYLIVKGKEIGCKESEAYSYISTIYPEVEYYLHWRLLKKTIIL